MNLFRVIRLTATGLCMFFLSNAALYGQNNDLVPYRKADKWGYANRQLKLVYPAVYDSASPFNGNMAVVKKGMNMGVISEAGTIMLSIAYQKVSILNSKFIRFQKDGKTGICDHEGHIIILPAYLQINVLGKGPDSIYLKITNDKYKTGLADAEGHIIVKPEYDDIHSYPADNRYVELANNPPTATHFMYRGLANRKGKIVIPVEYQEITRLSNGYFVVLYPVPQDMIPGRQMVKAMEAPANVYRYELYTPSFKRINDQTQTLNKMIYAGKGIYIITNDAIYGLMDSTGKIILDPEYDMLSGNFNNGCIMAVKKQKISFINSKGKPAFPGQFDKASEIYQGYIRVANKVDEKSPFYKYGIINTHGKQLVPILYDNLGDLNFELVNGKIIASLNGKKGVVDTNDFRVVPIQYSQLGKISEGLINVGDDIDVAGQKVRKWGYIDEAGKLVVPYTYDVAEPFKNGKAIVSINTNIKGRDTYLYGIIGKNGKEIAPVKYLSLIPMIGAPQYMEGKIIDDKGQTRVGLLDTLGHIIIPFEYNGLGYIVNGCITAVRSGDTPEMPSSWGFINLQSGFVLKTQYDGLTDFNVQGFSVFSKEGKSGIINKSGEIKIAASYERITHSDNEYFIYYQGDKQGILNAATSKVISAAMYNYISGPNNGLFYVVKEGKAGYMDAEGRTYWED